MKSKRLLTIIFIFFASQLFAIYSESGNFFVKPSDINEASVLNRTLSLAKPTGRPTRDLSYNSPDGHFIIHYDNDGYNSVPQDYNFHDTIPDFVFKAAEYLDDSFNTLHDDLGFRVPPTDDENSPEIDIFFKYDRSYYGVTQLETNDGTGAWTSYLSLSTLLGDSTIFYTYGLEGLRVTCAHELFHIFQLGYKFRNSDVFYFEMSSVWFEEYMYPEVNDYHSYIEDYSEDWNYAIQASSMYYNNVGYNMYIDKRFSTLNDNIIKRIWDRILSIDALTAIKNELNSRQISFEETLRDWGTAQVLCGPYSAQNFAYSFNDASELVSISFDNYNDKIIDDLEEDIGLVSNPGVFYYKLTNLPYNAFLFDMILSEGTAANLVCLNDSNSTVLHFNGNPVVIDGKQYDECILVIGLDEENATGSVAITELFDNKLTNIWPNPLLENDVLSISYVLLEEYEQSEIAIYDLKGRKLYSRILSSDFLQSGLQEISLRPQNLASGVYIIALHTENAVIAEKFTFIK